MSTKLHNDSFALHYLFTLRKHVSKCRFVSENGRKTEGGRFDAFVEKTKTDTDMAFDWSAELHSDVELF